MKPSEIDKPVDSHDITTLEELMSDIGTAIQGNKLFTGCDKTDLQDKETSTDTNRADKTEKIITPPQTSNHTPEPSKEKELVTTCTPSKTNVININSAKDSNRDKTNLEKENSVSSRVDSRTITGNSTSKIESKYDLVKEIIETKALTASPDSLASSKRTHDSVSTKLLKKSKSDQKSNKEKDALNKVLILESSLKQWISVDTLIFLHGESAVQDMLREANQHYKQHAEVMKRLSATSESNMNQLLGSNVSNCVCVYSNTSSRYCSS